MANDRLTSTGKGFVIAEATSMASATNTENFPNNTAVIAFVKEEGKTKGAIVKDGVEYGSESTFPADTETQVAKIGNLATGTNIAGKTALEVLDMMLNPEYYPYVMSSGSISLSCTKGDNGTTQEVGSILPNKNDYTATVAPYKIGTSSSNYATNTAGTATIAKDSESDFDLNTSGTHRADSEGSMKVKASASNTVGTGTGDNNKVKTNKGKLTKGVNAKAVSTAEPSASSMVDDNYHVKASTLTDATHEIKYRYCMAATTESAGNLKKLEVSDSLVYEATLVAGEAKIAVPATYKVDKFEETTSSGYLESTMWHKSNTQATIKDAAGADVTYDVYKRQDDLDGDTPHRFTISKKS